VSKPNYQKPQQVELSPRQVAIGLASILSLMLVGYLFASGVYSVAAHEQAVVFRFGKYLTTVGPGLHFKFPWIDQRFIVDQGERSLRLPHAQLESNSPTDDQETKLILTGDLYAAVVEWNVFWRISEPKDFLLNFDGDDRKVTRAIVAVARSVMHRVVGDYSAEEVLTGKREEITQASLKELSERLVEFGSGVSITDLQMQRVTPPDRVRPAFDEVNASVQQRDQLVNEAKRERNQLIPAAEAQRDRLIREAEGYASRKLAEAQGEISALLAKYEAYQKAPEVTRQRLYIEMREKVLQNSDRKIIIDKGIQAPLPVLNLDPNQPGSAAAANSSNPAIPYQNYQSR
jgi:modulator of FtsH protease HflK